MSSVFDPLIIRMLRLAGHNERADAIARAMSEGGGAPARGEPDDEQDHHAAGGSSSTSVFPGGAPLPDVDSDASPGHERGAGGSGGGHAGGASQVGGEAEADGGGHVGGGHEGDSGAGHEAHGRDGDGTHAPTDAHHAPAAHGAHTSEPAETYTHDIDPHNPLAGLHSDTLRKQLEREAFRGADATAQDSAIATEALSPGAAAMQRLEAAGREPETLDVSREAQAARVAALNGEIPAWARGSAEYDPALIRAREQPHDSAPARAPDAAHSPATANASSQVRASGRDVGMER
jgi:hypothetical protein